MTQFLRPDSNVTQTSFTNGFANIDEAVASDADFAFGANNAAAVLEVGLGNPSGTPGAGTTTFRYRHAKTNAGVLDGGGNAVTITAAVIEGTTVRATDAAQTCTGTWTERSWTPDLSGVTDWNNLRLRFTTSASGGSPAARRGGAVSWAELEVPNASTTVAPSDGSLVLAGKVPVVLLTVVLAVAAGALSFTGYAPSISQASGTEVVPSTGSILLVGEAPTVTTTTRVSPSKGSVSLVGSTPIILQPAIISPLTSSLVLSGYTPAISIGSQFTPSIKANLLAAAAENFLQKAGQSMPYNYNTAGCLHAIADVLELKAGVSINCNDNILGYLLKSAEAVEALAALSLSYNNSRRGYLRTIAEALEDYTGIPQTGSYELRIKLSSEVITF